jgi:hypothetical protein
MLFDTEVDLSIKGENVAGRQGGGREIMRDNEFNSEMKKKKTRFEECLIAHGARPEKGHLDPDVKMTNEIVSGHVLDNLPPIFFCNLIEMAYKESPHCSQSSPIGCWPA